MRSAEIHLSTNWRRMRLVCMRRGVCTRPFLENWSKFDAEMEPSEGETKKEPKYFTFEVSWEVANKGNLISSSLTWCMFSRVVKRLRIWCDRFPIKVQVRGYNVIYCS